MSRGSRRSAPAQPPSKKVVHAWRIQRASGFGVASGLVALMLAWLSQLWPDLLDYPYALMLAFTAFCGASILWISFFDMRQRGTSERMRPIRAFDLVIGGGLLLPSLYGLWLMRPVLGL
jgi:hypothetical protein